MKKILVALLLMSICLGASAKFRWGPVVGLNVSDFFWKQQLVETDQTAGYSAGIIGELMIPGIGFGIDMGMQYENRGAKVHFGDQTIWSSDGYGTTNLRFHTLQFPINLRFKWTRMNGVERIVAPLAYVGPLFNFNLAHSKCEAIENPAGSVGVSVGLGAELYQHFQITAGYMWGVSYDMKTIKLENFSARTQSWVIKACYLF